MPARPQKAFTLVELMVVITIIIVLIGLLAPALENVKRSAMDLRCMANLKGVGTAQGMYLLDSKGRYPVMLTWNMLFGNRGDNGYGEHGYNTGVHWPLNPYLGFTSDLAIVKIAECPSDSGDHLQGRPNSYAGYGTSYLAAWGADYFRVKRVYGVPPDPVWNPNGLPPANVRHFSRQENKVTVADWVWHANRFLSHDWTKWHSQKKRLLTTLMADGGVVFLDWINEEVEFPPYRDYPPDPSHIFW